MMHRICPFPIPELEIEGTGSWEECAKVIGVTDRWLRELRKEDDWKGAARIVQDRLLPDFLAIGARRLVQSAEGEPGSPGVTAAKALLAMAGITTDRAGVGLGQDPNAKPLQAEATITIKDVLANDRARRAACDLVAAVADGEADAGGVREEDEPGPLAPGQAP